ncbi:hypothetical protein DIS24_g5571 [Lasiodiplodia hormozganensis]|uniref:Aspergillopepsin-2 n=1 Tax=Lasiodiplodia hormozganensis TaxID=869390 RepID=A0AA39YJU9_9PEZI|nr:hypothetical protein DIS24_g5571 [Lasiodiplodia hormozganensis]
MPSLSKKTLLLALAGNAAAQYSVRFGPYYSLGATTSYIVEAETTLYPGKTPDPQQDRMVLWPGMGTSNGQLVQSIVSSSTETEAQCGGSSGQWCVFASTYTGETQISGDAKPMSANQGVTINYKYDEASGNYTQTVSIEGQVVSTLSTASGKAQGWGTAVECQDECSGIVNAHTYQNTTIKLAAADSAFKGTLALNEATATELTSPDGGITWTVDKISIAQSSFTPVSSSSARV